MGGALALTNAPKMGALLLRTCMVDYLSSYLQEFG